MIDFNRPAFTGKEFEYIRDAVERGMLCGDGIYTKKCSAWMEERCHVGHVMLTTSCTNAEEMAAFLADICINGRCICASRCKNRICGYPSGYHEY